MMRRYISVFYLCFFWLLFTAQVHSSDEQTVEINVIQKDNISNLCRKFLSNPNKCYKVISLNRLSNPDLVLPGQALKFPIKEMKGLPVDGSVTLLRGSASVSDRAGEQWRVLRTGDRIYRGNSIKTGTDGLVEITYEDGTSLILKQDTTLIVNDSTQYAPLNTIRQFFLEMGRTVSRLKEITGRNSRYEIRTPSAVAAARGTVFRVGVDDKQTMRTEVIEGVIGVTTASQKVEVKGGEGTLAKKDGTLLTPRKLLDPPGLIGYQELYRTMPVRFRFVNIEGAGSYRIGLTKDMTGYDILQEKIIQTGETLQVMGLADGSYFLQSQSIDREGLEGPPSDPVSIRIRINPLPPMILAPANASRTRETSVDIRWMKVQDAARYHVQVAEDYEFSRIVRENADLRATDYRAESLDFKTYYFRVSSVADDGYEGVSSDIQSFTVVPVPPAPEVEKPAMDDKKIILRWPHLGEGISYRIQIATDVGFNHIVTDSKTDQTSIILPQFKEPGTYYVRTQGIDSEGYAGTFSLPQSFEIKRSFTFETLGIIGIIGLLVLLAL